MSDSKENITKKPVSRRNVIKWTGALAAVGVVGVGLGIGGELLLRPNVTKTIAETSTSTETQTATATVTQPTTLTEATTATTTATATKTATTTATQTSTQTQTQNNTVTQTTTQNQTVTQTTTATTQTGEVLYTMMGDGGPFYAHVVNGQWIKSSPLVPNLPVAANAYYGRNRNYSVDRIRYPMIRVDFNPSGARNQQNRGISGFVRITWDEALTIVANELTRVKNTYGVGAVLATPTDHQWTGTLHNASGAPVLNYPPSYSGSGWGSRFWSLFGGCSIMYGGSSNPGNQAAGPLAIGVTATTSTNSIADILANSKMLIHWGVDTAARSYAGYRQLLYLKQFQQAGIKQVVIDPFYNDTAALFGAQWIPIVPNTDEALLAAIAYVWFTNSLISDSFASAHVYGYTQFKNYVLGVTDGIAKTPAWASAITQVPTATITQLAQNWASMRTYVMHGSANAGELGGGINRRTNGIQALRMMIGMCAISGNIGVPGGGEGGWNYTTTGSGQKSFTGVTAMTVNAVNFIPHIQLGEAILSPPLNFGSIGTDGQYYTYTYPKAGTPPIHLIALSSDNGYMMNQQPGMVKKVLGLQSTNIDFVYAMGPWWGSGTKMADIVLPTLFLGERDDIATWENIAVYMHTVCNPVPNAMNDLDVYTQLATKLGFGTAFTGGQTPAQWLQTMYASNTSIPLTFAQFQSVGFYQFPTPVQTASVLQFAAFNTSPTANPIKTASGLVELYSNVIAASFGTGSPYCLAQYVAPTEGATNGLYAYYPLIMLSPHPKNGRHSQWQNIGWVRTNDQMFRNGYRTMYINSIDASARGIADGAVVKIYNQRAATVCTATVSERVMPGTLYVYEGAWYQPITPGNPNSTDIGGNVEALIDNRFEEMTGGMLANALVNVQVWNGV